ncbi:hypothetical protein KUTeg_013119 [Tegillarca granosa]|uniref:Uncharacterized protein n=1 Tax=Tegillarca granosa TaxID=220873 RepID=A0ABQ9EWV0_TEGGR|nr:hypothetical protein KUTeg_013119 [Tegillarca granosa]
MVEYNDRKLDEEVYTKEGDEDSDSLSNGATHCDESAFSNNSRGRNTPFPPPTGTPALGRRTKSTDANRHAQQVKLAEKAAYKVKQQRARKKRSEKRQDQKAAKTLSAILLAFIVTWTPYQIVTAIEAFCAGCVPAIFYKFGKLNFKT